jgi:membrane protease YdiL (CAAX protease family)
MSILDDAESKPLPERSEPLLAISIAAFLAYWVVTPAVYQLIRGHAFVPATQPTSQPAAIIGPHDLIALSIAAPCIGLLTLVIGNLGWIKDPFAKLGLTVARFREGGWMDGVTAAAIVVPVMFGVVILTQKFWDLIHFAHPTEHDLLRVLGVEPSFAVRSAIIISAIVLAPLFEEFFFRGMIQRAMRSRLKTRWPAILIASFLFTAVHGAIWLAPPIFFLSLCLGYLYDRTGNLWVPMIVHASFNATSVVMFLLQK